MCVCVCVPCMCAVCVRACVCVLGVLLVLELQARLTALLPVITYHGDVAIAEQQMSRNAIDMAALVQWLKLHVAVVIYR